MNMRRWQPASMRPKTPASVFWMLMCLIGLMAARTSAASDHSLLEKVRANLNRIKPFKVLFVQQVFLEGELEIEESGEILFKDSSELKWTYLDPDYKVFILKDDHYRFYDRENNQLMKGKITEKKQRWVWQLLFADEISEHITCNEPERMISINWEGEDLKFRIFIGPDGLPVNVVQHDISGARYEYRFERYQPRIKIKTTDFEMDLPEDVDIIDGNME
jgi:outer membrane lipoprotein-sorting protein